MQTLNDADKRAFAIGIHQKATVAVTLSNGNTLTITNTDLVQDSLEIDRYVSAGNALVIGTTVAAQLDMVIYGERFEGIDFGGAKLEVSIKAGNSANSLPLGVFWVDKATKKDGVITILAYDAMMKLETPIAGRSLTYLTNTANNNAQNVIYNIGQDFGFTLGVGVRLTGRRVSGNSAYVSSNGLLNYTCSFKLSAPSQYTYRQLCAWLAEVTGTCCFFDAQGRLCFDWYDTFSGKTTIGGIVVPGGTPQFAITRSNYVDANINSTASGLTNLTIQGKDTTVKALDNATSGYVIKGNPFLQEQSIPTTSGTVTLSELVSRSFALTPQVTLPATMYAFSSVTMPLPFLELFDCITIDGVKTYISYWHFKLNGNMEIGANAMTDAQTSASETNETAGINDPYAMSISGDSSDGNTHFYAGVEGFNYNPGGGTESYGRFVVKRVKATPFGIDFEVASGTQNDRKTIRIYNDGQGGNYAELIGNWGVHEVGKHTTTTLSQWMTQVEEDIYYLSTQIEAGLGRITHQTED